MSAPLRDLARRLGGEVAGGEVLCPGPGHSRKDRSLSVRPSADSHYGFLVYSFANDDWRDCLDHVRHRLGLERRVFSPSRTKPRNVARSDSDYESHQHEKARWLWQRREPLIGSIGERYLREARAYNGPLPATLAFLKPTKPEHHPAIISPFAMPEEAEPGLLRAPSDVGAVHLILLKPDGADKIDSEKNKITVGSPCGLPIALSPVNDLLGLTVHEGIEDALSAFEATGLGAWASGSAPFMPALADAIRSYVECVTVGRHSDQSGRIAAQELARRIDARGVEVLLQGGV
jgi:hypothetical protein